MNTDTTKQFYEEHADEFEEKTRDRQKKNWIEKLHTLVPHGGTILDLGCAYGRDAKTFVELGYKVIGVDFSEAFIAKARVHVPEATFIVSDIREFSCADASLDAVYASAILLHIPKEDTKVVLRNMHRFLKPNGKLFFFLYVGQGEGLVADERYVGVEKYYAFFTKEEFRNFLVEAGYGVLEATEREKDSYERQNVLEGIAVKL
jgi:ubiquinone/menaquinone biosynthesis C-methylase UbiE